MTAQEKIKTIRVQPQTVAQTSQHHTSVFSFAINKLFNYLKSREKYSFYGRFGKAVLAKCIFMGTCTYISISNRKSLELKYSKL